MLSIIIPLIISTVIAIILAFLQVRITRNDQINKIDHVFLNSFKVGKGLTSVIPGLTISYKSEPLINDIRVIHGKFVNTGRNDIDTFNGESDIKLILPDGCIIKEIKTCSSNMELVISPQKDKEKENVAVFGIKQFMRPEEAFYYTIVVEETHVIENIQDNLEFYQRIKGTRDEIKNSDINKQIIHFRNSIKYFFYISILLLTLPIDASLVVFFPDLDRKFLVMLFIIIGILLWLSIIYLHKYFTKRLTSYLRKRSQKKYNN